MGPQRRAECDPRGGRGPDRELGAQHEERVTVTDASGVRARDELVRTADTGRHQPTGIDEPLRHDVDGRAHPCVPDKVTQLVDGDHDGLVELQLLDDRGQTRAESSCHTIIDTITIRSFHTVYDTSVCR